MSIDKYYSLRIEQLKAENKRLGRELFETMIVLEAHRNSREDQLKRIEELEEECRRGGTEIDSRCTEEPTSSR